MAINQFHQDYRAELVVWSCDRHYRALGKQLNFEAAVQLRSLTFEQIFANLNQASEQHALDQQTSDDLAEPLTLLQGDPTLREMTSSPLMLNIMVMAYQPIDISSGSTPAC